MKKFTAGLLGLCSISLAVSQGVMANSHNDSDKAISTKDNGIKVTTLAQGLEHPWGMAFLPNGDMPVSYTHLTLPTILLV